MHLGTSGVEASVGQQKQPLQPSSHRSLQLVGSQAGAVLLHGIALLAALIQTASIMQDLASLVSLPCHAGMDPLEIDSTVPVVQSLVLLDAEGKRIAVKYFDENK